MIYTPKFLSPKNKSIDAIVDNEFSWQSQGEPQTHYQLKIYKNSDNSLIYDSTKLAGNDTSHTVPSNSLSNNVQYKWTVESFGLTGSAISDYAFLATNSAPVVLLTVPATLTTQTHKFIATYSQAENISIKKYRFILYNADDEIIQDTDWIYGFTPEYTVDGLLNGNEYSIECMATSQNDMVGTSGKSSFTVTYALPDVPRSIKITPSNTDGINIVNWGNLKQVTPIVTGSYQYVDGKFEKGLLLNDDVYITYNEEIAEDFTFTWHTSPLLGFEGILLKLDDDFEFGYEDNAFYVINQNIKFISNKIIIYSWEDLSSSSWSFISNTTHTWNDINFPAQHMNGFLFIGITFNSLVVKRYNETISNIEMGEVSV